MPKEFTLSRLFNASVDKVWKAHTEFDRLKQWWGPKGFTWVEGKLDLKPGGIFHYCMKAPTGHLMWGKFVYKEIIPQKTISFVVSFSDEFGGASRHPLAPTWPLEVLNKVTFDEVAGETKLTITGHPVNASPIEVQTYESGFEAMKLGFTATMNQLEEYLAKK